MRSLLSRAPRGARALVLLGVCLQELLGGSLGLCLVVQLGQVFCAPRAIAFPSLVQLASFPSSPIALVAALSTCQSTVYVPPLG